MAQDKKVLFEALDDKAKAALRRKSIRDLEIEQRQAKAAVLEISSACPVADGIHDFEAGAKELKTTATELKERYANASAHFTECQSLNVEKTRSEGMRVISNANVVGEQEYREQGYASYPGENIFSRLERLHGAEELSEGNLNLVAGEQRDIAIPTATFHDINNAVMKRSGGSDTPPTGIVTSKPVNVESPYEAGRQASGAGRHPADHRWQRRHLQVPQGNRRWRRERGRAGGRGRDERSAELRGERGKRHD